MVDRSAHWNDLFRARTEAELTWFEDEAAASLELIAGRLGPGAPILDVGGGTSRLVDGLLARGLGPVTVLDLSEAALRISRERLGAKAALVTWIAGDITRWVPAQRYALWHDRAVFHFLTDRADRDAYVAAMCTSLDDGGIAIIATFAEDGPEQCAGLPVRRYTPDDLAAEIDRARPGAFEPLGARRHLHVTPRGATQSFQISLFRRSARGRQ